MLEGGSFFPYFGRQTKIKGRLMLKRNGRRERRSRQQAAPWCCLNRRTTMREGFIIFVDA